MVEKPRSIPQEVSRSEAKEPLTCICPGDHWKELRSSLAKGFPFKQAALAVRHEVGFKHVRNGIITGGIEEPSEESLSKISRVDLANMGLLRLFIVSPFKTPPEFMLAAFPEVVERDHEKARSEKTRSVLTREGIGLKEVVQPRWLTSFLGERKRETFSLSDAAKALGYKGFNGNLQRKLKEVAQSQGIDVDKSPLRLTQTEFIRVCTNTNRAGISRDGISKGGIKVSVEDNEETLTRKIGEQLGRYFKANPKMSYTLSNLAEALGYRRSGSIILQIRHIAEEQEIIGVDEERPNFTKDEIMEIAVEFGLQKLEGLGKQEKRLLPVSRMITAGRFGDVETGRDYAYGFYCRTHRRYGEVITALPHDVEATKWALLVDAQESSNGCNAKCHKILLGIDPVYPVTEPGGVRAKSHLELPGEEDDFPLEGVIFEEEGVLRP